MAEQFALQQRLGQGRTVHLHESVFAAPRVDVDGLCDEFLAGACLTLDHHRRGGGGHLADGLEHVPHAAAVADHVVHLRLALEAVLQATHLVLEPHMLQGFVHLEFKVFKVEWLLQVIPGTGTHHFHSVVHRAVGGHDNDHRFLVHATGAVENGQAVLLRHAVIGDHQVKVLFFQQGDGLTATAGLNHLIAAVLEGSDDALPDGGLILSDQNPMLHGVSLPWEPCQAPWLRWAAAGAE